MQNLLAVRKEFTSTINDKEDWQKELHNLSLLSELKHPNIVEILSSYTHRRKHNLIFRLASHGDLTTLFSKSRPEGFESDQPFYYALAQLASAICTVHNFTSEKLNLNFIGCHHDLNPKNVLFNGRTFILSDFGLSRIADASESSKEVFEIGKGHYLAPECLDFEDECRKHIISRPSDIWSFGCIIAELLTYLIIGPSSTSTFKNARATKIGATKTYTFHAGRIKANPGVELWLSSLEEEGDRTHQLSLQLVRSMLALNPDDRPKAPEVSFSLGYIAIVSYIGNVGDLFSTLMQSTDSIEADMEWRRFRVWTNLLEANITAKDSLWRLAEDPMIELDSIIRTLVKCKEEIQSILERYANAVSPLYGDLRALITQLHNFLPPEIKKLARSQVEKELMETEDLAVLAIMQDQYSDYSATERIGMLLTIKRMSMLAFQKESRTRPDLFIQDPSDVILDTAAPSGRLGEHSLAKMRESIDGPQRRVVVEWIQYTTAWEESVTEELFARVEAIASLLNNPAKPTDLVLHCFGYYHEPSRHAFGVVYEFPNLTTTPRTLSDVIVSTMDTRSRPALEDRYRLAYRLATSIIDCHNVGWMHKNVSAHNVAFFHSQNSHPNSWIQNPYIIGFNHSRRDDSQAFTLGPGVAQVKEYQHPLYYQGHRFTRDFDFYSFGIVLLEIGLWTTLKTMTTRWKLSSLEELRVTLLSKRVPLLAHSMGNGYREAVEACLNYMPGRSTSPSLTTGPERSLSLEVLAGLGKCPCDVSQGAHSFAGFSESTNL
jgi:serine/threonine protein kinase